ncbi:MAG: hypothetical protein NTZ90_15395 [Proteobacteria bacterium]|jgi:hypothetical protein|nr:hypothetical protein [Pseudomonadota bacterium]
MAGAFEAATKTALEEMIQAHAQASKFGYILSPDGLQDLVAEIYGLIVTSRSLKAAGDRLMSGGPVGVAGTKSPSLRPKR